MVNRVPDLGGWQPPPPRNPKTATNFLHLCTTNADIQEKSISDLAGPRERKLPKISSTEPTGVFGWNPPPQEVIKA